MKVYCCLTYCTDEVHTSDGLLTFIFATNFIRLYLLDSIFFLSQSLKSMKSVRGLQWTSMVMIDMLSVDLTLQWLILLINLLVFYARFIHYDLHVPSFVKTKGKM